MEENWFPADLPRQKFLGTSERLGGFVERLWQGNQISVSAMMTSLFELNLDKLLINKSAIKSVEINIYYRSFNKYIKYSRNKIGVAVVSSEYMHHRETLLCQRINDFPTCWHTRRPRRRCLVTPWRTVQISCQNNGLQFRDLRWPLVAQEILSFARDGGLLEMPQ
jgi:hypothetical protein